MENPPNTPTKLPSRVHVIGICGVATSALAIAFHKAGVKVTGSDKGFFPPVSTELEKHGISFYAGWHPEKMTAEGVPDVVIIGTASGSKNIETAYAIEHNIPMYSFAEAIGEFFAKRNSIVCVGTWGKTSSTALLSFILDKAEFDPTYMFGGVSLVHESSARLTDSLWSVFEGDEYKSSPTDVTAKFFYYKATHLLLSAVSWDHADLYPTERAYFEAFEKLIESLPDTGFIVACTDHNGVRKLLDTKYSAPKKIVTYGKQNGTTYTYGEVTQTSEGLSFDIRNGAETYSITSPLIGAFQAENITGCFAMAREIGVPADKIISAIAQFTGLKRRLEKRLTGDVMVFDDIAHSPEKALSVLMNLRSIYTGKVIAIFEPNIGGRERAAALKYENAFKPADIVIIPRLTTLKVAEGATEKPMEGDELTTTIAATHPDARYMDDDGQLVTFLASTAKKDDVIVFLGSHGFRGMIEQTITSLRSQYPS